MATANFPPTLLVHGTDDRDVPYRQSKDMIEKLQSLSVPAELMTLHGAGHELEGANQETVRQMNAKCFDFLKRHLLAD